MPKKRLLFAAMPLAMALFASQAQAIPVAGGSSGIFENPTGPTGMIAMGVGTNNFSWGNGTRFASPPSSLGFTGNSFSVNTGDLFSLGTLTYFNGTIASGTEARSVDLQVMLSLTSPTNISQNFTYGLGLINTLNTGDPIASADIVNFPSSPSNAVFTVDGMAYTLEFLGFGNITGSGFSTVSNFHVLEGNRASAELVGRIVPAPSAVPEPSTLLFLGAAALSLVATRRVLRPTE